MKPRRWLGPLAAALLGAGLLSGCTESPADAYLLTPQGGGATVQQGDIVVTNAQLAFTGSIDDPVVYHAGDTAPVIATIVETGPSADTLVAVSSPIATGGSLTGPTTIPPGGSLELSSPPPPATRAELTSLRTEVRSGLTYPVVLTFAQAGAVRLDVPVALPDTPRTSCPLPAFGHAPDVLAAPIGAPVPPTSPPPDCSSLPG